MAYSTLTDLKKLIPETAIIQLTDDENAGTVNQARVDEAIAQADAEIDGYCGGRYTVPFTTVPDIARKISVDIAIYNLYSRKVEEIPETRAERYKNAIRQLGDIASGKITIGEADADVPEAGGVQTNTTADDRIFTKDTLSGF